MHRDKIIGPKINPSGPKNITPPIIENKIKIGEASKPFPKKYDESSACEYVNANSTPTLLIHGAIDAMVAFEHSVRLQKKLNEFHVKNYFLDLPNATHGCDYNINGPSGQLSTFAVERFIASVVGK